MRERRAWNERCVAMRLMNSDAISAVQSFSTHGTGSDRS